MVIIKNSARYISPTMNSCWWRAFSVTVVQSSEDVFMVPFTLCSKKMYPKTVTMEKQEAMAYAAVTPLSDEALTALFLTAPRPSSTVNSEERDLVSLTSTGTSFEEDSSSSTSVQESRTGLVFAERAFPAGVHGSIEEAEMENSERPVVVVDVGCIQQNGECDKDGLLLETSESIPSRFSAQHHSPRTMRKSVWKYSGRYRKFTRLKLLPKARSIRLIMLVAVARQSMKLKNQLRQSQESMSHSIMKTTEAVESSIKVLKSCLKVKLLSSP